MKLQTWINRRFFLVTVLIFSFSGVLFYLLLGHVVDYNITEMLQSRKAYITLNLKQNPPVFDPVESPDHSLFIRQISGSNEYERFSDTISLDEAEKELVPFRKYTFTVQSGDRHYEVVLMQSLIESEDLKVVIFSFLTVLLGIVLLALFSLNRWLSLKAWDPFFRSLSLLNNWKIGEDSSVIFEQTGISEFDQLNRMIEEMMRKIQRDFVNLKEFTENTSHEIQTPLAIIKSKLELALQDKTLSEINYQRIRDAFESANRLSKLNQALLLLSRIENRQFVEKSEIDMCKLIKSRIEYLEELFALKQIELIVRLEGNITFNMNPLLADILINNLLSNALKHNIEKGKIIVTYENQGITISNTGSETEMDVSRVFNRFSRQTADNESNGLGLSIVNEICSNYDLELNYSYSNGLHNMTIRQKS